MGLSDDTYISSGDESTTSKTSKKSLMKSSAPRNKKLTTKAMITRIAAKKKEGSFTSSPSPALKTASGSLLNVTAPPGVLTPNPFSPLTHEETADPTPVSKEPKPHKPPPIYVKSVSRYATFCEALSREVGRETFTCKARITDLIVNASTVESYRGIIRYLKSHNAEYHTFQLEEDKAYRIVIRHLHQSTPTEIIKNELSELGHTVRNVAPVIHPVTKQTLPLFFVDLEPKQNNSEVFQIDTLCYCKIKIEEPHKQRSIVQCKRCQEYGHTRSYCQHKPKCVKCAGDHLSSDCTKSPNTPGKCALCNNDHVASYKGCIVHRELQRIRRTPVFEHPSAERRSHPAATSSASTSPPQVNNTSFPSLQRSQSLDKNVTFARMVAGPTAPQNSLPSPNPSSSSDIITVLNSFLTDFKTLITPLITLLTSMVNHLLPSLPKP